MSGEEYWMTLSEAQQNAIVNMTDILGSISFADGTTALSLVQNISDALDDRIYGIAIERLMKEISGSDLFEKADASLHGKYKTSYKSKKGVVDPGNLQLSFAEDGSFDADHDLYKNPVLHLFGEVVPNHFSAAINKVFGTKLPERTNQDRVRQMLMANPEIGITPSPDPKFNRKK